MTTSAHALLGVSGSSAFTAVLGALSGDSVLSWLGVAGAVGAAVVSWALSQRAKIAEQYRAEKWAEFILEWRIEQARLGKLDPTEAPPVKSD